MQPEAQAAELLGGHLGIALAAFYFRIQRPAAPQGHISAELQPAHGRSAALGPGRTGSGQQGQQQQREEVLHTSRLRNRYLDNLKISGE